MSYTSIHHPSSYRDPSGFIFRHNEVLYRQVNLLNKEHFDHFLQSGCYQSLVTKNLLIPHEIIPENLTGSTEYYLTIKPQEIAFISYPYEWSFEMLKDAALHTLQMVRNGLEFEMILKDATPYNIQWHQGKLIFIDSLSYEKYEQLPWVAYRQFCEAFLGPLLIMHYAKKQLPGLMLAYPEGIPITTISSLLPARSRFSLYTYLHIHLHAKYSLKKESGNVRGRQFGRKKLLNLIASLETLVSKLKIPAQESTWSEYYKEASQRNDYLQQKKNIIIQWLDVMPGIKTAADLGANEGEFSNILAARNIAVIAADFDPYCIDELYRQIINKKEKNLQPLVLDISNPSPSIGLNNEERMAFISRARFDLLLALAVIHHLVIGKNIPFEAIASMFSLMGTHLIIEYVPKDDDKIKLMLSRKKDIYPEYNEANFLKAFEKHFVQEKKAAIGNSGRVLYFFTKNR